MSSFVRVVVPRVFSRDAPREVRLNFGDLLFTADGDDLENLDNYMVVD